MSGRSFCLEIRGGGRVFDNNGVILRQVNGESPASSLSVPLASVDNNMLRQVHPLARRVSLTILIRLETRVTCSANNIGT